jgi:hypothetical protein
MGLMPMEFVLSKGLLSGGVLMSSRSRQQSLIQGVVIVLPLIDHW